MSSIWTLSGSLMYTRSSLPLVSGMSPETVEYMAAVLDATHQEGEFSTIYSTIFDLNAREIYLYFDHHFEEPVVIDVIAELEKGAQQVHVIWLLPKDSDKYSFDLDYPFYIVIILSGIILFLGAQRAHFFKK